MLSAAALYRDYFPGGQKPQFGGLIEDLQVRCERVFVLDSDRVRRVPAVSGGFYGDFVIVCGYSGKGEIPAGGSLGRISEIARLRAQCNGGFGDRFSVGIAQYAAPGCSD